MYLQYLFEVKHVWLCLHILFLGLDKSSVSFNFSAGTFLWGSASIFGPYNHIDQNMVCAVTTMGS